MTRETWLKKLEIILIYLEQNEHKAKIIQCIRKSEQQRRAQKRIDAQIGKLSTRKPFTHLEDPNGDTLHGDDLVRAVAKFQPTFFSQTSTSKASIATDTMRVLLSGPNREEIIESILSQSFDFSFLHHDERHFYMSLGRITDELEYNPITPQT